MRFMVTIRANEESRKGCPPNPKLMAAVAKLGEEAAREGKLLITAGIPYLKTSTQIAAKGDGKLTITDGPFTETKELVAGFAIFEVGSREEMIERTRRFMQVHLDVMGPDYVGSCEIHELQSHE